jgi:hypothetical protein
MSDQPRRPDPDPRQRKPDPTGRYAERNRKRQPGDNHAGERKRPAAGLLQPTPERTTPKSRTLDTSQTAANTKPDHAVRRISGN